MPGPGLEMNTGVEAVVTKVVLPKAAQLPDDQGGVIAVALDAVRHDLAQLRPGSSLAWTDTSCGAGSVAVS